MVVQTLDRLSGHGGLMGLHIGDTNVRQYFPRHIDLIELELDHLRIACLLDPSFWEDRPEIHDLRLSTWLEAKRTSGKLAAHSAPIAMIPCGDRTFRLQVMVKDESDHALNNHAQPTALALVSAVPSSPAALDRRRRSVARHPDRRVGKLKNNDSASPATGR